MYITPHVKCEWVGVVSGWCYNSILTISIFFKLWILVIEVGDCYGNGGRLAPARCAAVVNDNQTELIHLPVFIVK